MSIDTHRKSTNSMSATSVMAKFPADQDDPIAHSIYSKKARVSSKSVRSYRI